MTIYHFNMCYMSIFRKFIGFCVEKDLEVVQRLFRRKSGIIYGRRKDTNSYIPIMYLSKPKWVTEEEFQELLNAIDIQFLKK